MPSGAGAAALRLAPARRRSAARKPGCRRKPAHLQIDHHGPADHSEIVQPPPVPAVDPRRRHPAQVTGRLRSTRSRGDQHRVRVVLDLLDMELLQIREQQVQAAGFLACQAVLHNDLAAARDDQFLVEQDLHEAAVLPDMLLRNRHHHPPAAPHNSESPHHDLCARASSHDRQRAAIWPSLGSFSWPSSDASEWATRIERGLVRITTVTRVETGYSTRSGSQMRAEFQRPPPLPLTSGTYVCFREI